MNNIKFLCNGSPRFNVGSESFQAKVGFNEMPEKFSKDPYYSLCVTGGIIQDFVSSPTDQQQEDFVSKIQVERERADALQKELEELKARINTDEDQKKKK